MGKWLFGATLALALLLAWGPRAHAFCGFYVAQGDKPLTSDATMVVMMREGTRTVLSMQNDYAGPPEDFAMVVPVPVVLHRENVKTLPREVFAHVDLQASPRLVEYWEQDPCPPEENADNKEGGTGTRAKGEAGSMGQMRYGVAAQVTIEATFTVGEYDVVILAATDSLALDTWLRENGYHIPPGAADVLRPYVASGSLFFVAKVDVSKVTLAGGRARLSPLRFHYDAERFSLPVRLGLLNSAGHQELVVHILGRTRYDVANYPRATIPTNLELDESQQDRFPQLYAALFDQTLERNPRAVVTEYAWAVSSCDPCPGPTLSSSELDVLGADVLPSRDVVGSSYVLTRLHTRYSRETLGDDLVFTEAPAITGGRQTTADRTDASPAQADNFQARYIVRHPWRGAISCASPERGRWGGPPGGHRAPLAPRTHDPTVARGPIELAAAFRPDTAAAPGSAHDGGAGSSEQQAGPTGGPFRAGMAWGAVAGMALAAGISARSRRRGPAKG